MKFTRREDERLLTGRGRYVDDIDVPGQVHIRFVRSQVAHGRIRKIDVSDARALPGVYGVWTGPEIIDHVQPLGPSKADGGVFEDPLFAVLGPDAGFIRHAQRPILAVDIVRYVGEPIVAIAASDPYVAEDAVSLVDVSIDDLPPLSDPFAALADDAVRLYDWPDNVCLDLEVSTGDVDAVFSRAPHVTRRQLHSARVSCSPLEGRGVLAVPDVVGGGITVYSSTQIPHMVRDAIAEAIELPQRRLRVVAPDVGGGFGAKAIPYPEELFVPWVALTLGRPVKWIEDRYEHFVSAIGSRDQIHDIEIALDHDGTILGVRDHFVSDVGAFSPLGVVQPYNTAAHLAGCYRVPNLKIRMTSVVTNKPPLSPYRGAGRPEAVFAMERIIDIACREHGFEPAEMRCRNAITADEIPYSVGIPYRDGRPIVYDSGDFAACLEQALEIAEIVSDPVPDRGRPVGFGIACYVEGTGIGPFESAEIEMLEDGTAVVATGACSQGQSHETVFARIAADTLGLSEDRVMLAGGDTGASSFGWGTLASRSAVVAGSAIRQASENIVQQVAEELSRLWEVSPDDLVFADNEVAVIGTPAMSMSWSEVIGLFSPKRGRSDATRNGLSASAHFVPETVTFANGAHVVKVAVDTDTGQVEILDYVVVHDCGPLLDEEVVDGQIQGGVAQGIGAALFEDLAFDVDAQPLNPNFIDYIIPSGSEVPDVRIEHFETRSPRNPLGIKGVGEAGTIPVPAAVLNAIDHALRDRGVEVVRTPATPKMITTLLAKGRPS
ncbi:MAG: xanthine dehydrogenase family protein molybdopterin-binding subunit [Actinomycetota bacterium]|nr:xanthine dehydrogenase family protein molybdopterin-binding subunit [Actinomycetota bacterium]